LTPDPDPPAEDPAIPFRVSDRLRIMKLEVKMNIIQFLAGSTLVALLSILAILLSGIRL
jgi:hypothetical protein